MTDPSKQSTCSRQDGGRRTFFSRLAIGLSGLIAVVVSVPAVGFILGPVLRRTEQRWRRVGEIHSFSVGSTVLVEFEDPSSLPWAGVTAKTGAWLRRETETEFIAFSINCRHLGCPVRWLEETELFMCPCHGGVYYRDGEVAAGPPPQALARIPVRVEQNHVEIQTAPVPLTG